ncbi:hypothetical protein NPIL_313691 [Nephila pilipes]|uniref:Uncharacterized protein n=1 Tax=Nephila pilipes TaxID=299642 RepID=A0A8X6P925_NEPPI|nr:hypothetical protein NPIL_313691 [Nephila pilipes]
MQRNSRVLITMVKYGRLAYISKGKILHEHMIITQRERLSVGGNNSPDANFQVNPVPCLAVEHGVAAIVLRNGFAKVISFLLVLREK